MNKQLTSGRSIFTGLFFACFLSVVSMTVYAQDTDTTVMTKVQTVAQFPGGLNAWVRYLERSLKRDLLEEQKAPAGRYTVVLSFIVDVNGQLIDVQALNDPGYGTKAEAERVLRDGPRWVPAEHEGKKVKYRHKQSITFFRGS